MKIRKGFVTNSSSSSFIIARNKELTEKQKEIILDYVSENFLGTCIASTNQELDNFYSTYYHIDTTKEDWQKTCWEAKNYEKELAAIKAGNSIYLGSIDFEETDYVLKRLYKKLWEKLSNETELSEIKTNLDY